MLISLRGICATKYPGHGIALLQKEARSFHVRQDGGRVYVDAAACFEAAVGSEEFGDQILLRKGNLGVFLKEATEEVPDPIEDRDIDRIGFAREQRGREEHGRKQEEEPEPALAV